MAIILSSFSISTVCKGAIILNEKDTEKYLYASADYIIERNPNPDYGSIGGEWTMLGLARFGAIEKSYIDKYESNLHKKVQQVKGVLSQKKYTDYSRVCIAYSAIGNKANNCNGYNLLKPLAELDNVKKQGLNGIVYALIALNTKKYDVPKPDSDYDGEVTTKERLVELILNSQLEDGGFAMMGKAGDVDMTAMVIQALAPYYHSDGDVKKCVDYAVTFLAAKQCDDGGYKSGPYKTAESTAQVLTAISELRISVSDPRFIKNNKSVLDGLLEYYKLGGYSHTPGGNVNAMATEQAMYAMVAYYRSIKNKNRLYDMTDHITYKKIEEVNKDIKISKSSKKKIKGKKVKIKKIKKVVFKKVKKIKKTGVKKEKTIEKTKKETKKSIVDKKNKNKKKKAKKTEKKKDKIIETTRNQNITDLVEETSSKIKTEKKTEKKAEDSDYSSIVAIFLGVLSCILGIGIGKKRKDNEKTS